ncbi:MAG: ABC transporter ATP-binding protein [Polyangiaceae bacterium]|nr:ABC transporter ATP-binding protein [Polyangiaceae bacterium]
MASVSFSVARRERIALLGLNGSGKTTLLMSAAGLLAHDGTILVDGVELTRHTLAEVRGKLGYLFNVPEDQLLFPRVIDDVAFGLLQKGISHSEATTQALEALGVLGIAHLAQLPPHHLSHGQSQRVALAGALITSPPLLLLDEPSAALDPPARRSLTRLLNGLTAAVVVATHDVPFARSVCTRFVVLEQGRVVFDGTDPTAVLERWERATVRL